MKYFTIIVLSAFATSNVQAIMASPEIVTIDIGKHATPIDKNDSAIAGPKLSHIEYEHDGAVVLPPPASIEYEHDGAVLPPEIASYEYEHDGAVVAHRLVPQDYEHDGAVMYHQYVSIEYEHDGAFTRKQLELGKTEPGQENYLQSRR